MNLKKKIFILILGLITVFIFYDWYKMNYGFEWSEDFKLVEIEIIDTVEYETENALILVNKKDLVAELGKMVEEYSESTLWNLNGEEIKDFYPDESFLIEHLDTISQKFYMKYDVVFDTRIDTISFGEYNFLNRIEEVNESEWSSDTFRIVPDFCDKRNTFVNSMDKVVSKLITVLS